MKRAITYLAGEVTGASHGFFPTGARVLVDGRDEAIVKTCFPEGSTSYMFPHYKLDFVGGDKNVVVSIKRVGVEYRTNKTNDSCCREPRILGGRCVNCGTWDES